jgi:protein-tyrosine-phosphatase
MKVLFICKHNRFRSKVAEVLFNKYTENKNWEAESAGIQLDPKRKGVALNVRKVLKKIFNINKINNVSRKLTKKMIKKADLIVNVADNVKLPKNLIKGKKVLHWKITDTSQEDYLGILKRVFLIKKKVRKLVRGLN